jgi:hypothetical protein
LLELKLKYPLWIVCEDAKFLIVDNARNVVAQTREYAAAYELLRMANCSWKFCSEIALIPKSAPEFSDNPGRVEAREKHHLWQDAYKSS